MPLFASLSLFTTPFAEPVNVLAPSDAKALSLDKGIARETNSSFRWSVTVSAFPSGISKLFRKETLAFPLRSMYLHCGQVFSGCHIGHLITHQSKIW